MYSSYNEVKMSVSYYDLKREEIYIFQDMYIHICNEILLYSATTVAEKVDNSMRRKFLLPYKYICVL